VVDSARAAGIALAAAVLAGCGGHARGTTGGGPSAAPRLSFADAASQPLALVDHGAVERRGAITVHDVSYASGGRRVDAYLVEPARAEPSLLGVVVVHGSGGSRAELLPYAIELARRGVLAIAPTMPSERPQAPPTSVDTLLAQARAATIDDVVAVRRAGDVLVAQGAKRLGYLGWSSGGKTGAFVAASDARFRAFALLSAGAATVARFVAAAPAGVRPRVRRALESIDPIRYVALARAGTLLLEDGTHDAVVPRSALENIVHAAPRGTVVRWYPTGHALSALAYRAAIDWLLARL
jgi:dienelactone hydrolase